MLAEGLWSRIRRRKAHRKRRERRQHFGDLVQMDGSFHAWFEERGPRGCLMNMVDDATTTTCCRLGEQETPAWESAHDAFWAHVRALGDSHYCHPFSAS